MATDYGALIARHRSYFLSGNTRSVEWREAQLDALQAMMTERAGDFFDALWKDLRRNRIDADHVDVKYVVDDAAYARHQLRRWMHPLHVSTPLVLAPGRTEVRFDPLGVGLIIGSWNYPIVLCLSPLVAAISGGNAAVIKPSEVAPACAETLARLVPQYLDTQAFSVVLGGVPETTALLEQPWDHILFTGSPAVGKIVMKAAAKHLTPVLLELGGKSPTIVHSSANLKVAARRIAQGRWVNSGQTCTAADHVLVFKDVAKDFLEHLKNAVIGFYGNDPQASPDYGRIVNTRHFDRLMRLFASGRIFHGGRHDRDDLFIAPTILVDVDRESPIMQEEVFGPILPVLEIQSVEQAIAMVNAQPSPLGLYLFAEDASVSSQILNATRSGDAAVNDCTVQPLIQDLPFGGVGNSGIGKYHGEWGFRAYTNARGVLHHSTMFDPGVRYPPYSENERLRGILGRLIA
jgi:acyl-CoA reductase-like NAD-dependent aldehyde dehydrogenase